MYVPLTSSLFVVCTECSTDSNPSGGSATPHHTTPHHTTPHHTTPHHTTPHHTTPHHTTPHHTTPHHTTPHHTTPHHTTPHHTTPHHTTPHHRTPHCTALWQKVPRVPRSRRRPLLSVSCAGACSRTALPQTDLVVESFRGPGRQQMSPGASVYKMAFGSALHNVLVLLVDPVLLIEVPCERQCLLVERRGLGV